MYQSTPNLVAENNNCIYFMSLQFGQDTGDTCLVSVIWGGLSNSTAGNANLLKMHALLYLTLDTGCCLRLRLGLLVRWIVSIWPLQVTVTEQQVGSCCPLLPFRQNSGGKGLVIKERSLYSKVSFRISAFHLH